MSAASAPLERLWPSGIPGMSGGLLAWVFFASTSEFYYIDC
jgi:hypothetical protein